MGVLIRRGLLVVWLALVTAFIGTEAQAQELSCSVSVDYSQLTGNDYSYLNELERRIEEYVNERSWTDDRFRFQERIDCELEIIIQADEGGSDFRARLVVATLRPIYGTTQSSPVVRINDTDWSFEYNRGTPLIYDPQRYDPLTSVLDFYANIILGYDYDTFSEKGGTPFYEEARRVADLATTSGASGWTGIGNARSRTELVNQLLDPRYEPLRRAYFEYHFSGLDRFVDETQEARGAVIGVLENVGELRQITSRAYAIDLFFSAKYRELAAIFMNSDAESRAYGLLSRIDPSHLTEYNQLIQ